MNKKIIIILLLILYMLFTIEGDCISAQIEKKDPFLAGVLSWYMPGLGQFYSRRYVKGAIFWVVENTLFISAVLTIADLNFSVNEEIGFQFNIKPKEKISSKQEKIGISLFAGYAIFHIYNVIDAIQSVKEYNLQAESYSKLNLGYMNIANNGYYMLNYKF